MSKAHYIRMDKVPPRVFVLFFLIQVFRKTDFPEHYNLRVKSQWLSVLIIVIILTHITNFINHNHFNNIPLTSVTLGACIG